MVSLETKSMRDFFFSAHHKNLIDLLEIKLMKVCRRSLKPKLRPQGECFLFFVFFFLKLVLIDSPAIPQLLFKCYYPLLVPAVASAPGMLYAMIL